MTCEQLKKDARSVYLSKEAIDVLIARAREDGWVEGVRHAEIVVRDEAYRFEDKGPEGFATILHRIADGLHYEAANTAPAEGQDTEGA